MSLAPAQGRLRSIKPWRRDAGIDNLPAADLDRFVNALATMRWGESACGTEAQPVA
jgi:hypothetical protein